MTKLTPIVFLFLAGFIKLLAHSSSFPQREINYFTYTPFLFTSQRLICIEENSAEVIDAQAKYWHWMNPIFIPNFLPVPEEQLYQTRLWGERRRPKGNKQKVGRHEWQILRWAGQKALCPDVWRLSNKGLRWPKINNMADWQLMSSSKCKNLHSN